MYHLLCCTVPTVQYTWSGVTPAAVCMDMYSTSLPEFCAVQYLSSPRLYCVMSYLKLSLSFLQNYPQFTYRSSNRTPHGLFLWCLQMSNSVRHFVKMATSLGELTNMIAVCQLACKSDKESNLQDTKSLVMQAAKLGAKVWTVHPCSCALHYSGFILIFNFGFYLSCGNEDVIFNNSFMVVIFRTALTVFYRKWNYWKMIIL